MKKIITLLALTFMLLIPINAFGENERIVDNANKLDENQRKELTTKLDALSNKYDMDIVVYLSVDKSFGDDIVSEGCEFFDRNGYGYGDDHRGLLLIVNYEQSLFDVITTGFDVRNKYDGYIEACYNALQDDLGDNPNKAVETFITWVDTRFISEDYKQEEPVVKKDNTIRDLSVSGVTSLIVSAIVGIVLKKQLKTEGKKRGANNYLDNNSFNLTRSGDIFLYRTTTQRKINVESNNSGGGHSVSHTSSAGISHGSGGGRKF